MLALYDDEEVAKVFDAHKDAEAGTLKPEHLPAALKELQVTCQDPSSTDPLTLDDFKRIARQPNEAEQWFQMVPLAGMMARAFGKKELSGLEELSKDQMTSGLQVFYQGIKAIMERRLVKLKGQKAKLATDGGSKFGGVLEGGNVDDFHSGLSDQLGKNSIFCSVCEC